MREIIAIVTLMLMCITASAQEIESVPFNGIITTPDGKGVKARISVINKDKQTYTDRKGRFGLTNIGGDDSLRIIIRRDTVVMPVDGRSSIAIIWSEEGKEYRAREDEELANIGFGYVKRRESTEFTSGISGERLRSTGCYNVVDALMICYPALRMINGELCLRGSNSIRGSSAVLILCDGMEINPNTININDVKSVEILKSTPMYGFRGVNGVILITTLSAEDILRNSTK